MERTYNSYRDIKVSLKRKNIDERCSIPLDINSNISKESLQEIINKIPDGATISLRLDYGFYDDIDGIYVDTYANRPETDEELQVRTITEQKKRYGKYLRSIGEL